MSPPSPALPWGRIPLVVGVLQDISGLASPDAAPFDCDLIELRVDLLGPDAPWREAARRWKSAGRPVLLTIRHAREGGAWSGDEAERAERYRQALGDVSAIDVELSSGLLRQLQAEARADGVRTLASFHDFAGTPAAGDLDLIVRQGRAAGADVVKIATFTRQPDELARLARLPAAYPEVSICVLGMGPLGPESRLSLPLAGSCLTYGYLDTPSAPGQLSAGELRRRLAEAHPGYRAWRAARPA